MKRFLSRFLCMLLCLSLAYDAVGCTKKEENSAGNLIPAPAANSKYTGQLPIVDKPVTLKYTLSEGVASVTAPPTNDLPVLKEYEKLTGVHIEWEPLPSATYNDVITVRMNAGADLPDMVDCSYALSSKLGSNGVIMDLTKLMEDYAPRMTKYYADPQNQIDHIRRLAPDGKIYVVNSITVASTLIQGILVNKFWLDKVKMKVPETADDFYKMLVAFRDNDPNGNGKKDEVVMAMNNKAFPPLLQSAFGFNMQNGGNYMVDANGKVADSRISSNYKNWLAYCNKLYSEGLMIKDYLTTNDTKMYEYVKNDTAGALLSWRSWAGTVSAMSPYGKNDQNNEVFTPIANLKDSNGNISEFKRYNPNPGGAVITKNCKNPDVAIKWLDFALYSKEAQDMYIYGIEGLTYKVENGKKVRLPVPEGKTLEKVLIDIGGRQPAHPYVQTVESRRALFPEWIFKYDDSFQKYFKDPFPGEFMPMTEAEQEESNQFTTDLTTYVSEMQAKFISGQEPLSNYDNYIATFNKIGGQRLTAINQARYDRYLKLTGKK